MIFYIAKYNTDCRSTGDIDDIIQNNANLI